MAKTIKINPDAFGEAMRIARGNRTQSQVGRATGIPYQQIWSIENNRRLPTIATLQRLLNAYGYELSPSIDDVIAELDEYTWSEAKRVHRVKYLKRITTTHTYLACCKLINFSPELAKNMKGQNHLEEMEPENFIRFEVAEGVGFYVKREEFQNKHNLIPVGNFLLPIEDLTTERARNIIACIARPERFTKLAAWARWSTHYPFGGLALLIKRALEQQKFETTATESAEAAECKP